MEEEMIGVGEGNPALAKACESLFYRNGNPMLYVLSHRLSEPADIFVQNCPLETIQADEMVQ
jgi:hypothetical protein